MNIEVHDRRGAQDTRPVEEQGIANPMLEADRLYEKHLKERAKIKRFWAGEGEFEPAFFDTIDDANEIREMAEDPYLLFLMGKKDKEGTWKPFFDEHGTRWIKVVPLPHADWDHLEAFKMPRFGDNSVNLTHGEQEEVRRLSGGSRLREEELSMDFRTSSKFLLDDILFTTVDFELPNFPEDVQKWLDDEAWPNHANLKASLIERLSEIFTYKVPGEDNRLTKVRAKRRAEQELRLKRLWGKFWHWWSNKCGHAKKAGRRKPMSNRQLASIKSIFEQFRAGLNLDVPVIQFWATVHCTKCQVQRSTLLPLTYQPMFKEETDEVIGLDEINDHANIPCETCGTDSGVVLWFEDHTILDGRREPDWFDIAQTLSDKINALYSIGASIDEIRPLESRLHFIEVTHIRMDADQLLWGEFDAIDSRYC